MDLKELEETAQQESSKNGLRGWTFGLSNTKRRLGVCKYKQKRIEIADHYAQNSPAEMVLDVLLHEIAHAIAGPVELEVFLLRLAGIKPRRRGSPRHGAIVFRRPPRTPEEATPGDRKAGWR